MKNVVKKIFANNDYYDDILGAVVTENKFKIWSIRIALLLIPVLLAVILVRDFF